MNSQEDDPDFVEQPGNSSNGDSSDNDSTIEVPAARSTRRTLQQSRPKRASELKHKAQAEKKRLLISRYVPLFNDAVRDIESGVVYHDEQYERNLQYGAVRWTRNEREAFYNGLAKYGKSETARIASLIGTKTEMEVRTLIHTLDRNAQHRATRQREPEFITLKEIPAAVEINEDCCKAMEKSACALALDEESREKLMGFKNYGDLYTIDGPIAAWVEEKLGSEIEADEALLAQNEDADVDELLDAEAIAKENEQDQLEKQTSDIVEDSVIFTVGRLFKLSNWIKLSDRIFMNSGSGDSEDNWRTLTKETASPALTCEAFSDFYTLAISLTRRIIQSAIFLSLSRTRALERAGINVGSQTYVRREDVRAALDILKMPQDAHDFWALSSRRCKLDIVYDRHRKSSHVTRLSHDQVEKMLLPRDRKTRLVEEDAIRSAAQLQPNAVETVLDSSPVKGRIEADSTDEEEQEGNDSEDQYEDEEGAPEFESPSDYEDYLADKLDEKAAAEEDIRLREQLGLPVPTQNETIMKPGQVEPDPSSHPVKYRKSKEELVDWKDRLLYFSEWEQYGPETQEVMQEITHQSKRRRLQ